VNATVNGATTFKNAPRAADIALGLGCKARPDARGNYSCRCPGPLHRNGDRTLSLSVKDGRNGRLLLFCFAGCSFDEIVTALEARGLWR
jgi:putative DNA primase/helicase